MIVVTGGAGFIGSAFVWKLNQEGVKDVIIVDSLGKADKWKNLLGKKFVEFVHKDKFIQWIEEDKVPYSIESIVHMGACSSTTQRDADFLMDNNFSYTRSLARWSMEKGIRFLYASSAATYGDGEEGYSDKEEEIYKLRPLNMYGYSKHLFDTWALDNQVLDQMAGLKFFNVFGPNEYHKGDMASLIYKAYHQIQETGKLKLFKSYRAEYQHGEQLRDFVYVKDCLDVMWWLLNNPKCNGIFNVGTGKARCWNDLAKAIFQAMGKECCLEYIEMPETIRDRYQYFTQAEMEKLRKVQGNSPFQSLEESVGDYIQNYLQNTNSHLC